MRIHTILATTLFLSLTTFSQDIVPSYAEEGKCYVRYTTSDVYRLQTDKVAVRPAYKIYKKVPAEYKTVTERVLIKEETTKSVVIPAVWGIKQIPYVKKEASNLIQTVEATLKDTVKALEIKPSYTEWEYNLNKRSDCVSNTSDACRSWIQKVYPVKYQTKNIQVIDQAEAVEMNLVEETTSIYEQKVIIEPERIEKVIVPAEYGTITKMVLVKDAYVVEEEVPAVYEYYEKDAVVKKGGEIKWKEIGCEFVKYQDLDVTWNSIDVALTSQTKRVIDQVVMPLLINHPNVKLAIRTTTDSKGSEKANLSLSQKRADAILKYLIQNGINSDYLMANEGEKRKYKNKTYVLEDYKVEENETVLTKVAFRFVP